MRKKRIKTVERVVNKSDWYPPVPKFRDDDRVFVQIGYADRDLRGAARTARGRGDPDVRLWTIRYGNIKGMKLEKHIVLRALPGKGKT